jgi:hypothetical protein
MPYTGVRVKGLRELDRAFAKLDKNLKKDLRNELKLAGEPVRAKAESLAFSEISHIGPVWGRMKIGVTTKHVYVAPRARRAGGSSRPNLGRLLMAEAMEPALEKERGEVLKRVDEMLGRLGGDAGF